MIEKTEEKAGSGLPPFDGYIKAPSDEGYIKAPSDEGYVRQKWRFLRGKTGGANDSGELGGLYEVTCDDNCVVNVYLKQDPKQYKNISEVFASQFMRFLAKETAGNPDIIANVNFVSTDEGIYVASLVFEDYLDLYLEVHLAVQIPQNAALRQNAKNWKTIPSHRPGYRPGLAKFFRDDLVDMMIVTDRYEPIAPGLVERKSVDDVDLHTENMGVVPIISSRENNDPIPVIKNGEYMGVVLYPEKIPDAPTPYSTDIRGRTYYLYECKTIPEKVKEYCIIYEVEGKKKYDLIPENGNARIVHIDFGGALGDFRFGNPRQFDGLIHNVGAIEDWLRYRPSRMGPPAYDAMLPAEITTSNPDFFYELALFSIVENDKIRENIILQVRKITDIYKNDISILKSFAEVIGVDKKTIVDDADEIGYRISQYLVTNMLARQRHAKALFFQFYYDADIAVKDHLRILIDTEDNRLTTKHCLLKKFLLTQNINEILHVPGLQDALDSIQRLKLKIDVDSLQKDLRNYQEWLCSRIWEAYFKGELLKVATDIIHETKSTQVLLDNFSNTYVEILEKPNRSLEDTTALVQQFMNESKDYESINVVANSYPTCRLLGGLIGCLLGAAIGLGVGVVVGIAVGGPVGAIAGGIYGVIMGGIQGFGLGALTAVKAADYFWSETSDSRKNRTNPRFFYEQSSELKNPIDIEDLQAKLAIVLGNCSLVGDESGDLPLTTTLQNAG